MLRMQKGCPFCVFLFLPQVSNFDRAVFQFQRQTDIDCWYLGGKISEWERWTLSGNQFLSGQPLSAACRSICISDISAFVFLRSFHLYFFKLFLSICSPQLLWHSITILLMSNAYGSDSAGRGKRLLCVLFFKLSLRVTKPDNNIALIFQLILAN